MFKDLRRLSMLRELGERGTVGEVAAVLGVTPSAVSQQLRILEREAGVPLTEPAGRGIRLTSAGRALAATAIDISIVMERAEAQWRDYVEKPAGSVTLTTFPTGGEMLLPGLLRRVAGEPAVELRCHDVDPSNVPDVASLAPDYDVVVADSPTAMESWHERGLQIVPLLSEPLDVALPEGHRLAAKATLTPKDVIDETWIGVPSHYPYDKVLSQLVAVTGQPVRIAQRFADNGIVEAVVRAGHGIAILPRFTTRDRGNGLVTRPLVGIRAKREIQAVLRPDRLERPSVRFVVEALRSEARAVAEAHAAL